MNKSIPIMTFFLGALLVFLLMQKCSRTEMTPEHSGTLRDTIHSIKYDTITLKANERTVYKPIVQKLVIRDTVVNNIATIDTVYAPIDTLITKNFVQTLENKYITITGTGIVTGNLEKLEFEYRMKPQPVKKPSRWSVGITAGLDVHGQPNVVGGLQYSLINF